MTYTTPKIEMLGQIHALTLVPKDNGCLNSQSKKPCGNTDGLADTGKMRDTPGMGS